MSGTAKVKPPKNNAEWARNAEKRINQTEHPTSQRVGDWVLSTHPESGALIASNVNGGSIVLAGQPAPSDNADEVATQGQPYIKVERQQNQQEARGTMQIVLWDTLAYQTDHWGFAPTASDIVIPEDGIYYCQYHLAFLNSSSTTNSAVFFIDSIEKMLLTLPGGNDYYLAEPFTLNAGQVITCGAFVPGSGTMDFGTSGAFPTIYTSMTLLKLEVD